MILLLDGRSQSYDAHSKIISVVLSVINNRNELISVFKKQS